MRIFYANVYSATVMIQDRIRQIVSIQCNGNKSAFASRIGVTPTVVENILGTRSGKPGAVVLEKILCAFENLDARWLITGKGEMLKEQTGQVASSGTLPDPTVQIILDRDEKLIRENERLRLQLEAVNKKEIEKYPPPLESTY